MTTTDKHEPVILPDVELVETTFEDTLGLDSDGFDEDYDQNERPPPLRSMAKLKKKGSTCGA